MGGRMKFKIECPQCGGTGKQTHDCATCGGEGTVSRTETVEVRIKPGTRDGRGYGSQQGQRWNQRRPGRRSLPDDQDQQPSCIHPFRDDIQVQIPVTVPEAALGAKIEVPTIDGRAQLKIPPGTQSGQKLRMRGKGVPSAVHEGVRAMKLSPWRWSCRSSGTSDRKRSCGNLPS